MLHVLPGVSHYHGVNYILLLLHLIKLSELASSVAEHSSHNGHHSSSTYTHECGVRENESFPQPTHSCSAGSHPPPQEGQLIPIPLSSSTTSSQQYEFPQEVQTYLSSLCISNLLFWVIFQPPLAESNCKPYLFMIFLWNSKPLHCFYCCFFVTYLK